MKGLTIILLGRPGCGKGTQARILAKRLQAKSLGTGELLRKLAQEKTFLGKRLAAMLAEGTLVPTWLASFVWIRELGHTRPSQNIIFDGSPRTFKEAQMLDEVLTWYGRKKVHVLLIDISSEESFRRISGRKICVACKKPARKTATGDSITICHLCGGKIIRRSDDNPHIIRKRLRIFASDVTPIIRHYRAKGNLRIVNGAQDPQKVAADIITILHL